jgi:hypothetical protein
MREDCKKLTSIGQHNMAGMKASLFEILRGSTTGKSTEVVNEVRLVKVAAP